jgi:glutamate carboxypeptidase
MKDKISEFINDEKKSMLELLENLVNMDSGSYDVDGVKAVGNAVKNRLMELGFAVTMLENDRFAPHLLATKKGNGEKNIMFLGHMDTVFEKGTAAKRPFTIKGGRAYGPGVCDMKAGIVSLLYTLKALEHVGYNSYGSLTVFLNTDEERGSATSEKHIIEECRKNDMVLVVEPGIPGNYVVIERQGGGIFNLDIWGKPSHAGANPLDGIHAIDEAAHKIIALHGLTDYSKGKSVSVGVVKGGTRSNIIPEHVFMEIDIRCRVNADGHALIDSMQKIADTEYVQGTRAELTRVMYRPPIEKTAGNIALFEKLKKTAAHLGIEVNEKYSGGGSDGNYTSAEGIPTMDSLGPIGELEHTDDEFVLVDTLFSRTALLSLFVMELTGA